jgi:hypothetical protein
VTVRSRIDQRVGVNSFLGALDIVLKSADLSVQLGTEGVMLSPFCAALTSILWAMVVETIVLYDVDRNDKHYGPPNFTGSYPLTIAHKAANTLRQHSQGEPKVGLRDLSDGVTPQSSELKFSQSHHGEEFTIVCNHLTAACFSRGLASKLRHGAPSPGLGIRRGTQEWRVVAARETYFEETLLYRKGLANEVAFEPPVTEVQTM